MAEYKGKYQCPWCDHMPEGYVLSKSLRIHTRKYHLDVTPEQLERHIILTRLPDLDLDKVVQRYRDRLVTMMRLQDQGLFIKKYLRTIGVLRNYRADLAIGQFLTDDMQTPEDITRAMAEGLQGKFRKASPEVRFQGYLNRDIAVLRKAGAPEEIIPIVKTLKLIKFAKKQMAEAIAESEEASEPNPE